ncbi:hypothetical protein VOLCADRAFT_108614 [Volvox carteri f. nagariensis]|uniref:Calcineurin-like phosphoesterase domain-containing protein n=1 Tax=Volvox carteri f. nagariensis TaxID=3068 RepID=D8UL89_VOLCA|nr:uncharacterized protein VOLCADRAFT_108614 [Volvox carteri f. nagariensis]EFJ39509.1 hypothetical protein VOLCADRAFT_108614 [Volvox carteri f. nagariensis]|eukprot:XP_002959424.1 hypothetical protein VOLCADRAFT_108614 [Volvox carteri f. nagariensis]
MAETGSPRTSSSTVVVSLSDMHGLHLRNDILDIPDGDLLVIAGDIELRNPRDVELLERWLASLPHRDKVVGFGNMDRLAYELGEGLKVAGAVVVVDRVVEVAGLRLLASPWSPEYAGVWQLEDEAEGQRHWSRLLPPDLELDVLVTHTPPYGYGDLTRGRHVGDKQLLAAVQALKRPPQLWICGHIHEAVGEYRVAHPRSVNGGILLVNAAIFYAGAHKAFERRAQPRAVSLPEGRVVAQGDPANLATRDAIAAAAAAAPTAAAIGEAAGQLEPDRKASRLKAGKLRLCLLSVEHPAWTADLAAEPLLCAGNGTSDSYVYAQARGCRWQVADLPNTCNGQ